MDGGAKQKTIIEDFEYKREYKELKHADGTKYIDGGNFSSWIRNIEVLTLKPNHIVKMNDDIKAFAQETQDKFKELFDVRNSKLTDGQVKFSYDASLSIIGEVKNPDKITVIPAKAGFGKSSYIYSFMRTLCNHINKGDLSKFATKGAIIVTDKIEVLREFEKDIFEDMGYYNEKNKTKYSYMLESWNKNSFKDGICKNEAVTSYEYGMCSSKECPFYKNCKMSYQKFQQIYSPILLMTNARFKQYGDQIEEYKKWVDKAGKEQVREIIIIDEKPAIIDDFRIDTQLFSDLKKTIEEIDTNGDEARNIKEQLLVELHKVETDFLRLRQSVATYRNCICSGSKGTVFNEEFRKHWKNYIGFKHQDALDAIEKLFIQGALWCNANTPFFKTLGVKDFYYPGFKTYIFDATSELDPDYDNERFQFLDIEDYKNYENVTFHIFKNEAMNMSKSAMSAKKHYWKNKAVAEWILNNFREKTYVVSYKNNVDIISNFLKLKANDEKQFIILDKGEEKPLIPHFGDTKGSNEFKDAKYMIQIGWNRAPSDEYLAQCLSRKANLNKVFEKRENQEEKTASLLENDRGLFLNYDEANIYMWRKMAVEFEQEVFRTSIRDFSADNAVDIYIFKPSKKVINLISQRFRKCKFIEINGVPIEFQEQKVLGRKTPSGEDNIIQRFIKWLRDDWDGSQISINEIKSNFKISDKNWEKINSKQVIKEIKKVRNVKRKRSGKGANQVNYWIIE
ncbi:hypothetical protein ACLM5H_08515 [Fredinandcohnia humi]